MPFALRRALSLASVALVTTAAASASAAHVFDFADHAPPRLNLMFMVNWFGISNKDPQGGGLDPSYGNWHWTSSSTQCTLSNDPTTCATFGNAGLQRSIASKRRPLAGIYSSSGRDEESLRRIDLMLSTTRRPCDDGARIDAFVLQLDSVKFTSKYPSNKQSATWDIAYRATESWLSRADADGLKGAVAIGADATVYWHFGTDYGVTTQAQRLAALEDDVVDMVAMGKAHPSATRVGGKLLLVFYEDSALMTADEWTTLLEDARARSGEDFYTLVTTINGSYFQAFDAMAPWVNLGIWGAATGSDEHARAMDYAKRLHQQIVAALPSYPKRLVFGGVSPGFDDYTMNWGACEAREIPRDAAVLQGEVDELAAEKKAGLDLRGVVFETWDDWTEGTEFEPDVEEGTTKLRAVRAGIGTIFGDPIDPAGDALLDQRWTSFGQARSCCFVAGPCDAGVSPKIDLSCPSSADAGPSDATPTVDASSGDAGIAPEDATSLDAADDAFLPADDAGPGTASSSGCSCETTKAGGAFAGAWLGVGLAFLAAARRRAR